MQINSASPYTPQATSALSVDNQNQVAEQRDRFRVQPVQQNTEQVQTLTQVDSQKDNQKSSQQTQQQNEQPKQVERFDVDEEALALVEQAQLNNQQAFASQSSASQSSVNQGSAPSQSFQSPSVQGSNPESYSTSNSNKQSASYDSPSQQNQTAVAAYSSVGQIAQRENIQQVFGVDLFA